MAAVIVTGATRGVGLAVARELAATGADLVLNARDAAALDHVVDALSGARVVGVPGDVSHQAVAERLVDTCVERFGTPDALVNNAGIVRDRTTLRMTTSEFDDVVAVDLRGPWLCGRAAARAMRDRGGAIVNVVSDVAFYGAVGQSNYMAAKAGLIALTTAWSLELARYGIRVNAVSPSALTDMSRVVLDRARDAARADGRPLPDAGDLGIGHPDQIAPLIGYLAGPEATTVTGQVLSFDGRTISAWSFPQVVARATAPTWTQADIAAAFARGDVPTQTTHHPIWRAP